VAVRMPKGSELRFFLGGAAFAVLAAALLCWLRPSRSRHADRLTTSCPQDVPDSEPPTRRAG